MVFTDNFGILLAGIFRTPSTGVKSVGGLKRADTGAIFSTGIYQTNTNSTFTWNVGLQTVKVGKGTSTPTRQDFDIENPFTTSPESGTFANLVNGYNSGLGKIEIPATLGATGGSGAISEYVKYVSLRDNIGGSTNRTVIFIHTEIDPAVNFIIGESINAILEVLI